MPWRVSWTVQGEERELSKQTNVQELAAELASVEPYTIEALQASARPWGGYCVPGGCVEGQAAAEVAGAQTAGHLQLQRPAG